MNLKYSKAELINEIKHAWTSINRIDVYNPHDMEEHVKRLIDKSLNDYGCDLCKALASILDRHLYSPEEQERDLGIR